MSEKCDFCGSPLEQDRQACEIEFVERELEPVAVEAYGPGSDQVFLSQAISLKRIADIVAPAVPDGPVKQADVDLANAAARISELEELLHSTLGGIYGRADLPDGSSIVVGHLDRGGITVTRPGREPVRIGQ